MNGKTGHRCVTPNSLRGEALARNFTCLPEGLTYHRALKIIRRHVNAANDLSRRAKLLMLALLQIQAPAILAPGEDRTGTDMADFTVFARNDTLGDMLGMSRRTVQKALAELRDRLLIWCNDTPDRSRSKYHGINLLPAFARVAELSLANTDRAARLEVVRSLQRQYATLKIDLEGMTDLVPLNLLPTVMDLIGKCDVWRRSTDVDAGLDRLPDIAAAVADIKAQILARCEKSESESRLDDPPDIPTTYKSGSISIDVAAPDLAHGLVPDTGTPPPVSRGPTTARVYGPSPDVVLPIVKAALGDQDLLPFISEQANAGETLRVYSHACAARIGLRRSTFADLRHQFGVSGASYILVQAMCDPTIRNRPGWVRSFLDDRFAGRVIDTTRAFDRLRRSLFNDVDGADGARRSTKRAARPQPARYADARYQNNQQNQPPGAYARPLCPV